MANTLIGCGGTGAHVALAFVRLHALGDPLGFFQQGRRPMDLPALYLVDQDFGDGADPDKATAWQKVRQALEEHPSRRNADEQPPGIEVSPLPVGQNKDFLAGGMTSLRRRYQNSDYLNCILSPEQREIEFSRGMMGSPAVGSLLFKLKSYDTKADDPAVNHDRGYNRMLGVKGRVAVVGSGIGGTGAAVGPTLAKMLSRSADRRVMAVMILNWFEFQELQDQMDDRVYKAQRRNRVMQENAHSGLRYYGGRLAEHAATVPIGIPRKALAQRQFTGDNYQKALEVYPHAAAAICCFRQFLDEEAYSAGLYHLDAEDPSKLGFGTGLPGGGTIGDLWRHSKTFVDVLGTFANLLTAKETSFLRPALTERLGDRHVDTGEELDKIRNYYMENHRWLSKVLGRENTKSSPGSFASELEIRTRLKSNSLNPSRLESPRKAALELFDWAAHWVREGASRSTPPSPNGVYWPEMREDEGLTPSPKCPGEIQRVRKSNVEATLDSFVDPSLIVQNGWPDPLAAVRHFERAISTPQGRSMRQLELLCLGLFSGELELRDNKRRDDRLVSIDQLVHESQQEGGGNLVGQALVRPGRNELVMGFTAPGTLFCPVPGLPPQEWSNLWESLTTRHGSDWQTARPTWGSATSSVRCIRAWIEARKKKRPSGTPPTWTRMFEGEEAKGRYGGGPKVYVLWDGEPVEFLFPSSDERAFQLETGNYEEVDQGEFLDAHAEVSDDDRTFNVCSFEIARVGRVKGIWDDHLWLLQKQGKIELFTDDEDKYEVNVIVSSEGKNRRVTLSNTLVLRREAIKVQSCTPMKQAHVPNSDVVGDILYPHYPIRRKYFDLVRPEDGLKGESILDVLKRGERPPTPAQPAVRHSGQQAVWDLPMRGRSDRVNLSVRLDTPHKAHWMAWPRFFDLTWSAYYIYQHCTDSRIKADVLWLDSRRLRNNRQDSEPQLAQTNVDESVRSYPVSFSERERRHTGGPPVAICVSRNDVQIGLYLVRLDRVQSAAVSMRVGIDFGTSHTTAALKLGNQKAKALDLTPELSSDCRHGLSLHISENTRHIEDGGEDGPLSNGTWFSRYVRSSGEGLSGLWPSEILTVQEIAGLKNREPEIRRWLPAKDYVIPPVGLLRERLPRHRIGSFKWSMSEQFYGKENDLREIYLDRIVEQVMAEALVQHGKPVDDIQFTFTYPLRTQRNEVTRYQELLKSVLERGSDSLGCTLTLHGAVGMFDESHAVKAGTERFGDVSLVGDLGGGTLDLIISAAKGGFQDAADSVMLGGTKLLKLIADREDLFPSTGSWGTDSASRLANLTAWVRTKGITGLYGLKEDRIIGSKRLGVKGFDGDAVGPKNGRRLIRRYFFLVCEFMARSLCAYLAKHWIPNVSDEQLERLRIRVYLRGNGWKLWHENVGYDQVEVIVQKRVMKRVSELWAEVDSAVSVPGTDRWQSDHHESDPDRAKRDVVKSVVNQSKDPKQVRLDCFSYTLSELSMDDEEHRSEVVHWFSRIPFKTSGQNTNIEFASVQPAIPLSSPSEAKPEAVSKLADDATRQVNNKLKKEGEYVGEGQLGFRAPVAAWIWEAVLDRKIGGAKTR